LDLHLVPQSEEVLAASASGASMARKNFSAFVLFNYHHAQQSAEQGSQEFPFAEA